jgi:hypothetical protein
MCVRLLLHKCLYSASIDQVDHENNIHFYPFIFNSIGNIKLYKGFYYYKENKKKRFKYNGIYNYSAESNKLAGEGGG